MQQTRQPVDLAIEARWIIPVHPSQTILEGHVVIIDQRRIVDILKEPLARERYAPDHWIKRDQHALMPGLVNAHTHAPMSLMRGFADDLPLMEWLNSHIWPAERDHIDEAFIKAGSELAIAEMLRGGTTCFNDMYFFPEIVARTALRFGIRAVVGMIVLEMPTVFASDSSQYIEKGLRLHDELRHEERITTAFAPHAPYTVEDTALMRIQTLADELDVPIHMHVHESAHEIDMSIDRFGIRPLERLARLGLTTPRLIAVHMTQLLNNEIQFAADQGISVVHCPQSNLKLASGMCPVAALLDAGVNVAIGTDGAASNNDLDMIEETRCAALLAKGVAKSPTAMPAHRALESATLAGARALGLESDIGSIEIGKFADLIAINLDTPRTMPIYDAAAQIAYSASSDQVSDVWVAGQHRLENFELTDIDTAAVMAEACRWRDVLASRSAGK
ncbi:MAG: N-ethylammeline chlorohydrolase [marine bacterium B5-7]|nr:MAG: N-ethylammeline chlorohydrolase [marine bacterium B5-7]